MNALTWNITEMQARTSVNRQWTVERTAIRQWGPTWLGVATVIRHPAESILELKRILVNIPLNIERTRIATRYE
eukprot:scaffold611511_cov11-Prasinocladus_malaysianus.AAC.1